MVHIGTVNQPIRLEFLLVLSGNKEGLWNQKRGIKVNLYGLVLLQ